MILIDGEPIEGGDLLRIILENNSLKSASMTFLSDQIRSIPRQYQSICILQGEQALVRLHQDNHLHEVAQSRSGSSSASNSRLFIGSEDATTCMIVVVHDPMAGIAWAAHYDEPLAENDRVSFLQDVAPLLSDGLASLFLLGAFEEPSGVSLRVCRALLRFFHETVSKRLNLSLACVHRANTFGSGPAAGRPACVNLAVDCETGRAHPACFEDRGPDLPRRMAYGHCSCSQTEMNGPRLLHVYETSCSRFLLPGFDAKLPNWHIKALENLSRLDDAEFLRCVHCFEIFNFGTFRDMFLSRRGVPRSWKPPKTKLLSTFCQAILDQSSLREGVLCEGCQSSARMAP